MGSIADCLSTTVSITLSTIPVEAPNCHSGVGCPSVDPVAIYPHESGTAPHFLALPDQVVYVPSFRPSALFQKPCGLAVAALLHRVAGSLALSRTG